MIPIPETPSSRFFWQSLAGALGLWMVFGLASVWLRPLFPVDETRYMTVAWEMHLNGDWLLPTLNFEAYHHKPPMLFWLINLCWSVFGVSRFAAAFAPVAATGVCIVLTGLFVRRLWPDDPLRDRMAGAAMILMSGSLPLIVYGAAMMFDHMLAVFVLAALMAVWGWYRTARRRWIVVFGLMVGLGILTKGPVMLLYVAFPVLLAPWWGADWKTRGHGWMRWYAAFLGLGLVIAAALALSWAIPAALRGGPQYRDMILWGQTAGRIVQSFDHNRPLWWYLPFLPLFLFPWVFWPRFLKSVRAGCADIRTGDFGPAGRFLVCWTVPALVCFSMISGKQVHYLIPLTPAVWMAAGFWMTRPSCIAPARPMGLIAVGLAAVFLAGQAVCSVTFFRQFDLRPVADVLAQEGSRPLAWVRNYHGELGFIASLTEPVEEIEHEDLPAWFSDHPDGVAVIRYRRPEQIEPYTVLHITPPEYKRHYAVVRPAGANQPLQESYEPP